MEIKRPTRCNSWFFITKLIVCSTCFGHHYAHHQELKSLIKMVAACGTWCFGLQVVGLVWSCRLCVRFAGCCNIPQRLYSTPDESGLSPLSTDILYGRLQRVTVPDAVIIQFDLLKMSMVLLETCRGL